MTSNPHPEHGPLWVERNIFRSAILARPHALMCGDALVGSLYPHQADAVEAQITPLPDGVYRARLGHKRGHGLAAGYELPAGWTAPGLHGDGPWVSCVPVCRIPAEPPAPPTEDVPLHELCGRRLPGCDWEVRRFGVGELGASAYDHPVGVVHCAAIDFTLNPDGTVTVQAQGVEP